MTDTALTTKIRLRVEGMDCASCAAKIENALHRMPGISDVIVSVPAGTVTVTHEGTEADGKIRDQISDLGYRVTGTEGTGINHPRPDQGERTSIHDEANTGMDKRTALGPTWWRTRKGMLAIASGSALAMAYLLGKLIPATERWAFLLAILVGLVPIGRRAISAARAGTPFSIEMLMSIAALGAVIIGATEEAATNFGAPDTIRTCGLRLRRAALTLGPRPTRELQLRRGCRNAGALSHPDLSLLRRYVPAQPRDLVLT